MSSPGRAADDVLGEDVAAASYGEPNPVFVALEDVVGHVGIERFHYCQSIVALVVDVVAWGTGDVGCRRVKPIILTCQYGATN